MIILCTQLQLAMCEFTCSNYFGGVGKGEGFFKPSDQGHACFGVCFFLWQWKQSIKSLPPPTDLTLTLPEIGQWLMVTQIRVGLLITQAYQTVETCKKQS